MKNKLTLVYPYYNNGKMLDRHFEEWASYQYKDYWNIIIVDDGSQRDPAINHIKDIKIELKLFYINEDIPWNQNGARNLAMLHSEGFCLLTDMDLLVSFDQEKKFLSIDYKKNNFYIPKRKNCGEHEYYHPHPNSYILHKDLYWKIGGMDEAFSGYYGWGHDTNFKKTLKKNTSGDTIHPHLTHFSVDDISDANTIDFGRNRSMYHAKKNPQLRERKEKNLPPIEPINFTWKQII